MKDAAFAGGSLGSGAAVVPSKGEVRAPVAATVAMVFPTGHAVGLVTDEGIELLVHIGLDTVELQGKYFETHVKQGDRVKAGQLLVSFDLDAVKAAGYDVTTPVIVSNTDDFAEVRANLGSTAGGALLEVVAR